MLPRCTRSRRDRGPIAVAAILATVAVGTAAASEGTDRIPPGGVGLSSIHVWLDASILVGYLVALAIYGLWMSRRDSGTKEGYFLGGRKFTWVLIGASLFATNYSTTQLMGEAGAAYKFGLAAANNDLIGALMLGLSAIFFIPMYLRTRLYTIPEFLERRFHPAAKTIFGVTFLTQAMLGTPIGYYAGGLAVTEFFHLPEQYLWVTCAAVGIIVGIYAVVGGLTSVVYVETIQMVIMMGGSVAVLVAGLVKVGGVGALHAALPGHFELLLPAGSRDLPWTAMATGVALHSAFFAFCSVPILQRALGAKDLHHAQLGMLFGAGLKLTAIFLFALPGVIALHLYPGTPVPDKVYALMIRDLLPAGMAGLVLAGLLAALLSSAESSICAISSVVALNIYPSFDRQASEQRALLVGKITGVAVILFGVVVAPFVKYFDQIYPLLLKIAGFMLLPVGTCFLLGRFVRRVNHQGAITTLVTGLVLSTAYVVLTTVASFRGHLPSGLAAAHFYHVYPVMFLFYVALLLAVSWLTPPPTAERLAVLDARHAGSGEVTGAEGLPWWRTFRFWWVVFLATVGTLYLIF